MREKIEIEKDRVKLLRLTPQGEWVTELELPLRAFMEYLASELPQPWESHPMLPPGCRWYGHKQQSEVVVIEELPAMRRMRFAAHTRTRGDDAPEELYELAFPYVIFAFHFMGRGFEEVKVLYRPAPLKSMEDELYLCNLFNVQLSRGHRAHNRGCLRPKPDVGGYSLNDKVERLVSHFWDTEFNLDIEDNGFKLYADLHPELSTLADWERQSREDPLFVLQFPWQPAGMTFGKLVEGLINQLPSGHWLPYSARNVGDLCYSFLESQTARPEFDPEEGIWRKK